MNKIGNDCNNFTNCSSTNIFGVQGMSRVSVSSDKNITIKTGTISRSATNSLKSLEEEEAYTKPISKNIQLVMIE